MIPEVLLAQWIARRTCNPEIAGLNPAEDDFGFRCFKLFQKFICIENGLCFTQTKIQMSDNEISSSEQPNNCTTKNRALIIVVERKQTTRNRICDVFSFHETLCRWKIFRTTEETNSKVQNQKTTFDCPEQSAKKGWISIWEFVASAPAEEDAAFRKWFVIRYKTLYRRIFLFPSNEKTKAERREEIFKRKTGTLDIRNTESNLYLEGQESNRK